ncbi:MAG: hypothetical protein ACM3ZA_01670 [Bacillota bacterium]
MSPDFVDQLKRGLHRRSSVFWLHGGEKTVSTGDIVAVGEDFVEIRGLVPTVEEWSQGMARGEAQGSQLSTVIPLHSVCAVVRDVPAGQKAFPGATRVRVPDTPEPEVQPQGFDSEHLSEEESSMLVDEVEEAPPRRRRSVRRHAASLARAGDPKRLARRNGVHPTTAPHPQDPLLETRRTNGGRPRMPRRHARTVRAQVARRSPIPASLLSRLERLERSILRARSQRQRLRRAVTRLRSSPSAGRRRVRAVRARTVPPTVRVRRPVPAPARSNSRVLQVSGGSIPIRRREAATGPYGWM